MSLLSNPRFLNGIEGKLISVVEEEEGKYLLLSTESSAWKYDTEESLILKTWFAKSFQKITHGLISNGTGGYSLVLNDRRVLYWEESKEVSLDALEPELVLGSHAPLGHFVDESKELYWVLSDGSLRSKSHEGKSILPGGSRVIQAEYLGGGKLIFLYSLGDQVLAQAQGLYSNEDSESSLVHLKASKEARVLGSNVQSSVYIHSQNQVVLLLSDKLLVASLLNSSEEQTIKLPPSYSLSGASIAPLGASHFVLTCKSPEDGYTLFLFNAAFGDPLILTHVNIKTVTAPLLTSGNNIFIQHGPKVALIRANSLPESLAELIAVKDNVLENRIPPAESWAEELDPMKLYELLLPLLREGKVESIRSILCDTLNAAEDVPELLVLAILEVYFEFKDRFSSPSVFSEAVLNALNISITPSLMGPLLKKSEFSFAKDFLKFFNTLMRESSSAFPSENLVAWISLVLDAHYLNFQLTRDEEGLSLLNQINESLSLHILSEDLILSTLPLMKLIRKKQKILPIDGFDRKNSSYFIDVIEL
eukprot:TRINITY_DN6006_c0_g1_i1.p1 TRINITY_DN6006_c0_g1~~TRINITY_DN6006_c0_g1_i1.p1  ORF type:complete len:534 (-),score=150.54 TRINITY_DN6006_c0_g1_i1:41-1642(-)